MITKDMEKRVNKRSLALWLSAALAFGSMPFVPAVSVMADEKPYIELVGDGIGCENSDDGCLITLGSSRQEREFAIRGVSEDGVYLLRLELEGLDTEDYPVKVFGEAGDEGYTTGKVSALPAIGKHEGALYFVAKEGGSPIEHSYSINCAMSVNLAPPKVEIVDGKFHITDEDNDPESGVNYVASAIKMTKSEFLTRYREEMEKTEPDDEPPFLSEIAEGPLEPGQEEELCNADAIFIHEEMSVDDLVKRATKISPGDMLYVYSVNSDTDYEDDIEDEGWYMPEECAQILLGGYVGVAGYSVKDGAGATISGDSISFTSSKEVQSLWFKPVSETGESVSERGICSINVSRNGLEAEDLFLSGNVSDSDYTEVLLKTKPHLGSYSISVSSNGRVSANRADRYVRDYEVSVNAAPAQVFCESGSFIINDEDNAEDQVYYLVSSNSIEGDDLKDSLDKMIEIKDGVSANVTGDVVTGDILYAYTVNRDTDPEDGVDDRGVYMAKEACEVIVNMPEPQPQPEPESEPVSFSAYQEAGNDSIVTDVSGNSLFDVSLITGRSDDGSYESVLADKVRSDVSGNIAIDPAWLGRDIKLELSEVSSNAVYLPVVRFIDGEIALDAQAPKAGDTAVFTASSNNAYVNADIVWYSVKAGKKAELSEGDSFEREVSYNASIYVHTTDVGSMLEKDLKLVQFIPGYETLPLVTYAELSDFTPVKEPVVRADGKDAGCDNYTGYTVNADYGLTHEHLDIAGLIFDDWKDIYWTENTVSLNEAVMMGRVIPSNADEKLTVSLVDTYFGGMLAAGVSANASVSSDNVVSSLSMNKTDDKGGFSINVKGNTLPGAGFATLHLDTDKGGNKAVEKFGDILVTVRYPDITGVSVNNVIIKYDNGSSYSTMRLSGLIPGQIYRGDSGSGNETETVFFVPKQDGTYTNKKFKNSQVTINRYNPKEKTIPEYKTLYGKERIFQVSECLAEPSRGLFFDYQQDWVYSGSKITPVVAAYNGDERLIEGQDFTVSYKNNINAGTGKIKINGKNGSIVGKQELEFTIRPADIADATIVPVTSIKGKAGKQPVVVYNGLKMTQKKTFNKLAKADLKCASGETKDVEITGIGNFTGTTTFTVRGIPKKISMKGVKLNNKKFAYNGHWGFDNDQVTGSVAGITKETADIVLPLDDENFKMGNAGSYKLAVCGKGDYAGFVEFLTFKIMPVKSAAFKLQRQSLTYDPLGAVFDNNDYSLTGINDEKLIEGMDYTVSYTKNKKVGSAKITITFKGSYKGTKKNSVAFMVAQADLNEDIDDVFAAPVTSEKKAKKNAVYLTDHNVLLKKGKKADYNTVYIGGGKMTVTGTGNYTGSIDVEFKVAGGDDISKAKIKAGKGQKLIFNGLPFSDEADGVNKVIVTTSKSGELRFFNNLYQGKALCVLYGDGETSAGSKVAKFKIKASDSGEDIDGIDDEEYDPDGEYED